jgi:hypothetical protein
MTRTLVALGLAGLTMMRTAPASAQRPDHLTCYRIKDSQARGSYTADLDGLVPEPGCTIKTPPVMACVPTTKTNVTPPPPGGGATGTPNSFFCYKAKCRKAARPTIGGTDQFGSHNAAPSSAKLLCAPFVEATITTTSTTRPLALCTTTTVQMCGNGSPPHTCAPFGACPGGQTCQTDASGCSCVGPAPPCSGAGVFFCSVGTCPAGQTCQTVCGADGNLSCQCH